MVRENRFAPRARLRMTLHNRTLIIICATVAGLVLTLYALSHKIMFNSFDELERRNACQNIERVLGALNHELSSLEATTADWGQWDDTYAFIQDGNPRYISSNIVDGTFAELRLNLIVYFDDAGQVVLHRLFEHSRQIQVSPDTIELLAGIIPPEPGADGAASGIVILPDSPMLISAQPILPSSGQGLPRGMLLMGRYLDAGEIEYLSEVTLFPLRVHKFSDAALPSSLGAGTDTYIEFNDQSLTGYTVLRDIHGSPALALEVEMPRTVYPFASATMSYLLLSILGTSLAFGVAITLLLEKQVVSRLLHLEKKVNSVGASGDLSTSISIAGSDEISSLAEKINSMLAALRESQGKLKEASEAKSAFLARMSHELRTPLNAIIGFSLVMLDGIAGQINETQKQCLNDILSSGEHLRQLINEVLDLSRIESRKLELKLEDLELAGAIESAVQTMKPLLDENGDRLEVELEPGLPPVRADRVRLKQVLLNLLGNARKFAPPEGEIGIEAHSDGSWCLVSVTDNGIGIEEENFEKIFEPFVQVGVLPGKNREGTGLGLALVRQFVEMWGGRIWVESRIGCGSRFTFTLPLAKSGQEAASG